MNDEKKNGLLLIFDNTSKDNVLHALGMSVNARKELVDCEDKVLTNQEFEAVQVEEFGGILQGSKLPIKKKNAELVKYFVSKKA